MKFEIKCSTFIRLASVCNFFDPSTPVKDREDFMTVRLEKVNGRTIAVSTNRMVMAIELLPHFDLSTDEICHVVLDPQLVNQCKFDSLLDATLTIETMPEIALATASTSTGWKYHGNACYWRDDTEFDKWRDVIPKNNASASKHVMTWDMSHLQALFESSPTGEIYFPRYIDASQPIILRDAGDDSWVGVFIPSIDSKTRTVEAEMPKWVHI